MEQNEQVRPQPNRDLLIEMGYDHFTYFPEYDGAIVGMDIENRVVYDYFKMAECLMENDDWDEETAFEWINYNTIRALPYIPNHPYILWETDYLDEIPFECDAVIGMDVDDRVIFDLDRMMEICGCDQEEAIEKIRSYPAEYGEHIIMRRIKKEEPLTIRERYTPKVRYQILLKLSEEAWGRKLKPGKAYDDLKIRWFVSYMMWKEGYSYSDIGRAMGRHYSSVINHVKHMFNVFDEPVFYAEECAKYAQFGDLVAKHDATSN